MKKTLAILLAFLMVLAMCAGAIADEKLYIPVVSKGFQHQFWQTVYAGAQKAAQDYNVDIYFDGPASETDVDVQVEMLKSEMAKKPKALALAALSTDAVMSELQECIEKGIPVIGFDSGVPNAPEGAIKATASTNNENAAALAADKLMEQEGFVDMLKAATADKPVVIGVISQEAVSASIVGRTTGFVNRMTELAGAHNTVSVTGHDLWKNEVKDAGVIINVQVSATTQVTDLVSTSNAVLNLDGLKAVFLSNENAVTGFLSATASFELRIAQVKDMAKPLDTELIIYGRLPLMVSDQCIIKESAGRCACQTPAQMADRMGSVFPVVKEYGCRNVVYNAHKLYLADKKEDLYSAGLWGLRMMFTTESARECVEVAKGHMGLSDYKPNVLTRGLYYRGVD